MNQAALNRELKEIKRRQEILRKGLLCRDCKSPNECLKEVNCIKETK